MFSTLGVRADQAVLYFILSRLLLAGSFGVVTRCWRPMHFGLAAAPGGCHSGGDRWARSRDGFCPSSSIVSLLKRRTKAIASGLPNALELLVVCVEAGLSLEDGLQRVARELRSRNRRWPTNSR